MDSVSVSTEEKKHRPEEPVLETSPAPLVVSAAELPVHDGAHGPEEPVIDTNPAPPVHSGAERKDGVRSRDRTGLSRTGLKSRCWRPAQLRLFTAVVRWVTDHELWFLGVALPPLWLPGAVPALVPLSFALLAALVLCRWIVNGRPVPRTPMNWPILVILLMLPVGLWASPLPETSWVVFCRILLGIALFYGLVGNASTERQIALVMAVSVLGGVGIALLGLLTSNWITNKLPFLAPVYSYLPRISLPAFLAGSADSEAGLFHPNMIGGTLALLIPFDVALIGWYNSASVHSGQEPSKQSPWLRRGIRAALWFALVLMCGVLLLSQSRMGLVAVAVALFVWAALYRPLFWLVVPTGTVGLLLAAHLGGVNSLGEIFLRIPESDTWNARPELWSAALQAMRDFPFTGVGLGAFESVVRLLYVVRVSPTWLFGHSHNLILQAGMDLGVAGMLSFGALLLVGAYCGWRAWTHSRRGTRWLAGGAMAALLAYVIFGMLSCLPLGSKPGFLFWLVLALPVILPSGEGLPAEAKAGNWKGPWNWVLGGVVILMAVALFGLCASLCYDLGFVSSSQSSSCGSSVGH